MSQLIVKIEGGLGNQLLQYLFGVSLSWQHQKPVYFDVSEYLIGSANRKLALFELDLPGIFIKCKKTVNKQKSSIRLSDIEFIRFLDQCPQDTAINLPYRQEFGICYTPDFKAFDLGYFAGYWQSYRYWETPDILLSWLNKLLDSVEQKKYSCENIHAEDGCALHIRRGDYLRPEHINWFGICRYPYYLAGLKLLNCKKNTFFSDDIHQIDSDYGMVSGYLNASFVLQNEIKEFLKLRKFRNLVLANSSYSYLAGLLANNRDNRAVIIAPYPWYSCTVVGPDMATNWILLNRATGRTKVEDNQIVEASSVMVLVPISHEISESELEQLTESLKCQSIKIDQVVFINASAKLRQNDLEQLLIKCPTANPVILSYGSSLASHINCSNSDFVAVLSIGESWNRDRLKQDIALSVKHGVSTIYRSANTEPMNQSGNIFASKMLSAIDLQTYLLQLLFESRLGIVMIKNIFAEAFIRSENRIDDVIYEQIVIFKSLALSPHMSIATIRDDEQIDRQVYDKALNTTLAKVVFDERLEISIKLTLYDLIGLSRIKKFAPDLLRKVRRQQLNVAIGKANIWLMDWPVLAKVARILKIERFMTKVLDLIYAK